MLSLNFCSEVSAGEKETFVYPISYEDKEPSELG